MRVLTFFLCLLLLAPFTLPMRALVLDGAHRAQCSHQLRQIASALRAYHQHFDCFPPACVRDKDGRPMHSWRVLILPYLDLGGLYNQYNFQEPWNGPHNKKLLTARPYIYSCLCDWETSGPDQPFTSYVAVVGSNAAWPEKGSRRLYDCALYEKDSETIMLVEVADARIHWTEPRDFSVDTMKSTGPGSPPVAISSKHRADEHFFFYDAPGAHVALVDTNARFLRVGRTAADELKTLLTVGGARGSTLDAWNKAQLQINWPHCIGLPIWLVSGGLLLYRAVRSRKRSPEPAVEKSEG
jgi:hypothetical protein